MDENMFSRIEELKLGKGHITRLICFTKDMPAEVLIMLFNEFGLEKEDIDFFIKNYRNLGIIFKLRGKEQELNANLSRFIYETYPNKKPSSKFDNAFFSNDYNKVLLVSTKRLFEVDLRKLNEKIDEINGKILKNNLILERKKVLESKFWKQKIFEPIKNFFQGSKE